MFVTIVLPVEAVLVLRWCWSSVLLARLLRLWRLRFQAVNPTVRTG